MKKGFTLVEVLFATVIIAIGVLVSYRVVQQIFAYSFVTSHRLVAAYVAKEGMEIVRNIRDTGFIDGVSMSEGPLTSGYWEASYGDSDLTYCGSCSGDDNDYETLDFYGYLDGSASSYKRRIRIIEQVDYTKVVIDIMWKQNGQMQKIRLEEDLYDWI